MYLGHHTRSDGARRNKPHARERPVSIPRRNDRTARARESGPHARGATMTTTLIGGIMRVELAAHATLVLTGEM